MQTERPRWAPLPSGNLLYSPSSLSPPPSSLCLPSPSTCFLAVLGAYFYVHSHLLDMQRDDHELPLDLDFSPSRLANDFHSAEVRESQCKEDCISPYLKGGVTKDDQKDFTNLYADDGLLFEARRSEDALQQEESVWIGLTQVSNDAPRADPSLRNAGSHDASYSSTAASEKSDKRKRKSDSSEEEEFLKPYECRFCPMKFAKSQALGGHMNRHRQEREHEQLVHAHQLVMQQGYSSLMMPGQNNCSTSLPKLPRGQPQLSPDSSIKYSTRITSPTANSVYASTAQSDTYASSTVPYGLSWNRSTLLGQSQSLPSHLNQKFSSSDDVMPLPQTMQPAESPLSFVPSYAMEQSSCTGFGHDSQGVAYERDFQGFPFLLDSDNLQMNPYTGQRGTMLTQSPHIQCEDIVTVGNLEGQVNISSSKASSSFPLKPSDVKNLSQIAPLEPEGSQLFNVAPPASRLQFMPQISSSFSSPAEVIRANASPDFGAASGSQIEGLNWVLGNQKIGTFARPLSNEEHHQTPNSEQT